MRFILNLFRAGSKVGAKHSILLQPSRFPPRQSRSFRSDWRKAFFSGQSYREPLPVKHLLLRLAVASAGTSSAIFVLVKDSVVLAQAPRPVAVPAAAKRSSPFAALNPPPPSLYEVLTVLRSEWPLLSLSILLVVVNTQLSLSHQSTTATLLEVCREAGNSLGSRTLESVQVIVADAVKQFLKSLALVIATGFAQNYSLAMVSERVQIRFRRAMLSNLLKQDISFFDEHPQGMLMSSLAGDVAVVQNSVVHQATGFVSAISDCVGSLYRMWAISSKGTLGICVLLPFLSGSAHIASGIARNLGNSARQQDDANMSLAGETISNIKTVQSFCEEERQSQLYSDGLEKSYALKHVYRIFNGVWRSAFGFLVGGSVGIGLYHGGSLVAQNRMTPGDVMTFVQLSNRVGNSLSALMRMYGELGVVYDSAARVMYFIKRKPKIDAGTSVPSSSSSPWTVSFRDVSFAYSSRSEQPVLNNLSLDLVPGGVTALVGPSGCGKSTAANLLQRFYDVQQGTLTFNGVDSKQCDTAFVRANIGVVSQEPVLFTGTVMDNIKFGSPDSSDERASAFVHHKVSVSLYMLLFQLTRFLQCLPLSNRTRTNSSRNCLKATRPP